MTLLIRLEPQQVAATWPRIERWVSAVAARSQGRITADLVKGYAERGKWQLWIALDNAGEVCAVGGTSIITYDTGLKSLFFHFGTGRKRHGWQHVVDEMVAWGKSQGCNISEGKFRIGWRRVLPGWNHTHEFLERVL